MIKLRCGHESAAAEMVRVPAVYPHPLFYRCGICGHEQHREWTPAWRDTMQALAEPHMPQRQRSRDIEDDFWKASEENAGV